LSEDKLKQIPPSYFPEIMDPGDDDYNYGGDGCGYYEEDCSEFPFFYSPFVRDPNEPVNPYGTAVYGGDSGSGYRGYGEYNEYDYDGTEYYDSDDDEYYH
jgi:hypothetical protein